MAHFALVVLVTWPLNGIEARGDFVLITNLSLFQVQMSVITTRTNHTRKRVKLVRIKKCMYTSRTSKAKTRGPFLESPGNLPG